LSRNLTMFRWPNFAAQASGRRAVVFIARVEIRAGLEKRFRLPYVAAPGCVVERRDAQPVVLARGPVVGTVAAAQAPRRTTGAIAPCACRDATPERSRGVARALNHGIRKRAALEQQTSQCRNARDRRPSRARVLSARTALPAGSGRRRDRAAVGTMSRRPWLPRSIAVTRHPGSTFVCRSRGWPALGPAGAAREPDRCRPCGRPSPDRS
jgi:hypothetical protein